MPTVRSLAVSPQPGRHADVPTRPAATVMLIRDGGEGLEVLMLRRVANAAFAAGVHVFPGGRVDEADGGAAIEPYCEGLDDAAASKLLGVGSGGLAYWVAAARECFEEAGVLVGRRRDGSQLELPASERVSVHDGSLSMAELCRRNDVVLHLDQLHYVAHWVTPKGESRRFDTRFFLTAAPPDQDALHDELETVASTWLRPADALAAMRAGDVVLLPPTIDTLARLSEHDDVASALDAARAAPRPERIEPRLRFDDTGRWTGVAMPGDDDYDDWA